MNSELSQKVRFWGMMCHLSGLAWFPIFLCSLVLSLIVKQNALAIGVFLASPLINLLVTFLVWMGKRRFHPFVDRQGREALNLQLSLLVYLLIGLLIVVLLMFIACGIQAQPITGIGWYILFLGILLAASLFIGITLLLETIEALRTAVQVYKGRHRAYSVRVLRFLRE